MTGNTTSSSGSCTAAPAGEKRTVPWFSTLSSGWGALLSGKSMRMVESETDAWDAAASGTTSKLPGRMSSSAERVSSVSVKSVTSVSGSVKSGIRNVSSSAPLSGAGAAGTGSWGAASSGTGASTTVSSGADVASAVSAAVSSGSLTGAWGASGTGGAMGSSAGAAACR